MRPPQRTAFHLTTLGAIDLVGPDGNRIEPILRQPKRLGLLAVLAIDGQAGNVTRDALLAMFWPETNDDRARRGLRQGSYFLRQFLEPAAVVGFGSQSLGLDPEVVACDANLFEDACRAGRFGQALELYRGDLLPALIVADSQEFDGWVDRHRVRLRALALEAARQLAIQAVESADTAELGRWARRMVQTAPFDEITVRDAMQLLADAGDRAGARDIYAGFTRRMHNELQLEPDPETQALADTLSLEAPALLSSDSGNHPPLDPQQPLEPPTMVEADATDADASATTDWRNRSPSLSPEPEGDLAPDSAPGHVAGVSEVRSWHETRSRQQLTAVALAVAATLGLMAIQQHTAVAPVPETPLDPIVLVRPFEAPGGEAGASHDAAVMTTLLRRHLNSGRGIAVRAGESAGPSTPQDTHGPARFALAGQVRSIPGRGQIEAELVDLDTGIVVWSGAAPEPAGDLNDPDNTARQLATVVREEIWRAVRSGERREAASSANALTLVESAEAARADARALRAKGLPDVSALRFAEADSLLEAAETAAPEWVEPIVARAQVAADVAWLAVLPPVDDRRRAQLAFERALTTASRAARHSPHDAAARETRATIALWILDFSEPDPERVAALTELARSDLDRAVAMDGRRSQAWSLLSGIAFRDAEFAAAYAMGRRAYDLDRHLQNVQQLLLRLFASAYEVGDAAGAAEWCDEIRRRFPGDMTGVYCSLALLAWMDDAAPDQAGVAWGLIEPLRQVPSPRLTLNRFELMVASVLARAGLPDSANAVIARATMETGHDPEILHFEAHARMMLGQADSAASLLRRYVDGNPDRRAYLEQSRRFRDINPAVRFP